MSKYVNFDHILAFLAEARNGETLKHSFDLTDETVDALLTALRPISREQVEKVWRGEWKPIERLWKYSHQWQCSRCGQPTLTDQKQFCDFCGAPMTDEAVEMVMEKLEALHGET